MREHSQIQFALLQLAGHLPNKVENLGFPGLFYLDNDTGLFNESKFNVPSCKNRYTCKLDYCFLVICCYHVKYYRFVNCFLVLCCYHVKYYRFVN